MKVLDLPGLKRFNTKINALIDKRIEKAMISHVLDSTNTSMVLGADVGPKVTQLINNVNTRVDRVNSDLGEVTNGNTQLKSKLYTGSAASGIVVTSRNNPISLENVSGQILAHIDSNQVGYVSTCPTNPVTFTIANGRVKMYVDNNLIGYLTTTTT